jgi:hypothetical protein
MVSALLPRYHRFAPRAQRAYAPLRGLRDCAVSNSNSTRLLVCVNDTGLNGYTVLTGETNFTVKGIDVFALTE